MKVVIVTTLSNVKELHQIGGDINDLNSPILDIFHKIQNHFELEYVQEGTLLLRIVESTNQQNKWIAYSVNESIPLIILELKKQNEMYYLDFVDEFL